MRTENLSIVFVDIAGFTPRTSAQTREENLRMLQRFDTIVRPLVRAYDGRVVKTIGDAYLLTFRSPTNALLCSMAVHDRIAETDAGVPSADRFAVRAAVNVGEVRIEGGDVYGEAVNIASRIEGKAAAGEIYFSESAYLSMTRSEVPCEEVGPAELKGITGTVRLYRVPRAEGGGLPFSGRGLDRVRDLLSRPLPVQVLAPAVGHARGGVELARGAAAGAVALVLRGFEWWRVEVRRNRAVQYATIAAVIALILFISWYYKRSTATPWQRMRRDFGF